MHTMQVRDGTQVLLENKNKFKAFAIANYCMNASQQKLDAIRINR